MTTPIKTFTAKYTDEYGAVHPEALIAVHNFSGSQQTCGGSDGTGDYAITSDIGGISWDGRFYVSETTQKAGFRTRSIVTNTDNVFDATIDVDVEREEIKTVMSGDMIYEDKLLLAIKLDFLHRFA
jgi:hypothetical protein